MAARPPQDLLAKHLSSSRGYPLCAPEPSTCLLSHRPEGLTIGDVGVVAPENGSFAVLFNTCLPNDHPFHQATGVPDGFAPIQLSDADIKSVPDAECASRVLTSSSVTRVEADGTSVAGDVQQKIGRSSVTEYTFRLSSTEGALLVLPEGAEAHDVLDPRPFFEQASRNATNWYRFAEEKLGRTISHDTIYVITGLHKARSWGIAGYQNERADGGSSIRFIVGSGEVDESMATGYRWETTPSMFSRVGPTDGLNIANQSVFIRGFKIALRSSVQGVSQDWVRFQQSHPSSAPSNPGGSWLSTVWKGISKSIGVSNEEEEGSDRIAEPDSCGSVCVRGRCIPEVAAVFHPSDVINQFMLDKEPSATVAITHDSDWGLLLDRNLLKPEELVQRRRLAKSVSEIYSIALQEGVAYLRPKSDSDVAADGVDGPIEVERVEAMHVTQPESLSVVSESNYRCIDESVLQSAPESRPADLHSIPSKFGAMPHISPESLRPIKIIVISDYLCSFCYICDKTLRNAIEACRDLPVRFDVELRPFTLVNLPPAADPSQLIYRNAYLVNKFGKEQAEIKLKAANEFALMVDIKLSEDSIVCGTIQAHRLSAKAYQQGGQDLQDKINTFIFDACLAKGENISDDELLADAAASVGFMSKEEATAFLRSTECLDCVEKMVEAARAQGINGVPFVIIDGKWAVNGLQPMECFVQIFRKLAQLPTTTTTTTATTTTTTTTG